MSDDYSDFSTNSGYEARDIDGRVLDLTAPYTRLEIDSSREWILEWAARTALAFVIIFSLPTEVLDFMTFDRHRRSRSTAVETVQSDDRYHYEDEHLDDRYRQVRRAPR